MYGMYTPTTFSGVNCSLKAFSANSLRLSTNWRMRATRVGLLDVERQHRVRHRAVGDLFVDAEDVPAPVATRGHRVLGVDRHLGAANRCAKLIRLAASAAMSRAPEAMTVPLAGRALAEAEFLATLAVPIAGSTGRPAGRCPALADVGGAALGAAV